MVSVIDYELLLLLQNLVVASGQWG
jgi:hypothetical protein